MLAVHDERVRPQPPKPAEKLMLALEPRAEMRFRVVKGQYDGLTAGGGEQAGVVDRFLGVNDLRSVPARSSDRFEGSRRSSKRRWATRNLVNADAAAAYTFEEHRALTRIVSELHGVRATQEYDLVPLRSKADRELGHVLQKPVADQHDAQPIARGDLAAFDLRAHRAARATIRNCRVRNSEGSRRNRRLNRPPCCSSRYPRSTRSTS